MTRGVSAQPVSPLPTWGALTRDGQKGERKDPGAAVLTHCHAGLLFPHQPWSNSQTKALSFGSLASSRAGISGVSRVSTARRRRSQGKGSLEPHVGSSTSE